MERDREKGASEDMKERWRGLRERDMATAGTQKMGVSTARPQMYHSTRTTNFLWYLRH